MTGTDSARRDTYPVTGELLIDWSDLPRWCDFALLRSRLAVVEDAPVGALVRIIVGEQLPNDYILADIRLQHVAIAVVCRDPYRLHRWVRLIREATQ